MFRWDNWKLWACLGAVLFFSFIALVYAFGEPEPDTPVVASAKTPEPTSTPTTPTQVAPQRLNAASSKLIDDLEPYLGNIDEYATIIGQQTGHLLGWGGHDCQYSQVAISDDITSYFLPDYGAVETLLIFDDAICMTYTGDTPNAGDRIKVIAMIHAQEQVNRLLAKWYSTTPGSYDTDLDTLQRHSLPDHRGWCMQSKKSEYVAVAIEYFAEETGKDYGLRAVMHDLTMPC